MKSVVFGKSSTSSSRYCIENTDSAAPLIYKTTVHNKSSFSGSLSFIGNALNGMSNTSFFKAVFFILLCGMVVFNLIFLMMYIVGKITGRNIYARCESEDCSCDPSGKPKCKGITRIKKRLPYIFWMNISLLILMALDIVMWCLNMNFWFLPF